MKKLLQILILLVSVNTFSQNLACCNDSEAVKKAIAGDWKLKGDTKNVIYRFSFESDKGFVEVLEELNLPPKAEKTIGNEIAIDDNTIVKIQHEKGLFYINIIYLYGEVSEPILELNDENFIYGKGASQYVLIRD